MVLRVLEKSVMKTKTIRLLENKMPGLLAIRGKEVNNVRRGGTGCLKMERFW